MHKDDFIPKLNKIRQTLLNYLNWFDRFPVSEPEDDDQKVIKEKNSNLVKIPWDSDKQQEDARRIIARIGLLLSHLRRVVSPHLNISTYNKLNF